MAVHLLDVTRTVHKEFIYKSCRQPMGPNYNNARTKFSVTLTMMLFNPAFIMNLHIPFQAWNSLTSWTTISSSRRTLLHGTICRINCSLSHTDLNISTFWICRINCSLSNISTFWILVIKLHSWKLWKESSYFFICWSVYTLKYGLHKVIFSDM